MDGYTLLDLAYDEDSRAQVDLNVFMTDSGKFTELQGTAEATPFSRSELDAMLKLAETGIAQLLEAQRSVVEPLGFPALAHAR